MVLKEYAEIWHSFVKEEQLTEQQAQLFHTYLDTLLYWNKRHNITALTTPKQIIRHHFQDSLRIARYINMNDITGIADIGSGGGFPGIPLKIKYPHLFVVLIEVKHKKIEFLKHMIQKLGLTRIEVYPRDWRTFLRTTTYTIDLFCARASLPPAELIRLFKPGCRYKNAKLVYWASRTWESGKKEKHYIVKDIPYVVGTKQRRYVVLQAVPVS